MGGLLGGLTKSLFGGGGEGDNSAALEAVKNIPLPVLREYYPELYKQVVSLNPEMDTAVDLGPSKMEGVSTDPSLRAAQMSALNKLQEVGSAGGRDAQFLSDAAKLQTDVNTNLQGQEGAIQQNMAARGMSGGGSELVARQMAAQNAANRQSQAGLDLNAQAQQRALQALMQSGQLGGQMQAQDFGQQSQKAQAADAISRFNAQNQQNIMSSNTANKNQAQQYNVQNQQSIANQNVGQNNQAQQYNLGLAQQNYNNQMAKATGVAQQYNNMANAKNQERAGDMGLFGNLLSAGMTAYGASGKSGGSGGGGGASGVGGGGKAGSSISPGDWAHGGIIDGKAEVPGDSLKNDNVNINVSPGELVVPRSIVGMGPHAVKVFADHAIKQHQKNFAGGGIVEPSMWDNIKSAFEEEPKRKKKPVPELDQSKAKSFASVFNGGE